MVWEKTVYARMFLSEYNMWCINFVTDLSQFDDYEDWEDKLQVVDTFPLIIGNCSNGENPASVHIQQDGKIYTVEEWYKHQEKVDVSCAPKILQKSDEDHHKKIK